MSGDQSGPLELNGTGGVTPGGGGGDGGSNGALVDGTLNGGTASPGGGGSSETGGQGAGDAGCSDGPPSIVGVGPPSPLTGCYLLIVIGEPHSQDHKDIILQRLIKGFLSWDVSDCHVDLEEELNTITLQALEGEEGKHGERLIQYASENLVTEILIHPQINTFIQCIRNLLSSFTRHRHIIHTGYTFAANGSWVLQDGTFSVVDFMEAFQEHEVQRVLRAYPETITMDIHCAPAGNWTAIQDKSFARLCRIRLNPVDVLSSGSDRLSAFVDYLATMIVPTEISELLESSDVVGNIRFSHPTLYVFPGGQGDAALFGINGFNMLVDGGFSRKSCFWDFVRHLDRLDAALMTRINNTNIKGISAVVERKNEAHVYPQIGHFFCNIPERKSLPSPDGDKDRDPLLVDLIEEGHQIVTNLKSLNLKAQNCYRDAEPINLYHKVGHGTLDMYVISPAKDSKEVKEFIAKWHAADPKLFTPKDSKEFTFPIQNIISICALLVWTPANPEDNITRILFPGSAPEYKILEGLEKMKNVEFMRHPLCTVKSIAPSLSTQTITKKSLKSSSIDKIMPEPILPSKVLKPLEKDNKLMDNKIKMMDNKLADAAKSSSEIIDSSGDEAKLEKHVTKSSISTFASAKVDAVKLRSAKVKSLESSKKIDNKLIESSKKIDFDEKKDSTSDGGSDKDDTEKKQDEDKKEEESVDVKKEESPSAKEENKTVKKASDRLSRPATARSRIDTKPPKVTKTIKKKDETMKSSPTTPKKAVEPKLTNGVSEKKEDEPKKSTGPPKTTKPVPTKPGKTSPKSTPAKSAKDANNRKVLEARQRPVAKAPIKKEPAAAAPEKKDSPPKIERKPISRRPKAAVPGHAVGGSPVKAKKVLKSEKDAVIRKAKLDKNGTTDSSLVSTPSADEAGVAVQKRIIDPTASAGSSGEGAAVDPMHQQQLAELKEEQDAVREIEAVFKRDSEKAKRHELLSEHREIQDSATEPEEEEEYLIIEKEEQYTEDSINEPESSATKEEEIQKHQRDSEESEKRKRDSLDGEQEEKADLAKVEGETATVVEIIEGDKEEAEEEAKPEEEEAGVENEATEEVKEETEVAEKMSPKHKQDLEEEVQDIIASAKEIAKSKMETSMDGLKTEEISSFSPDDKISSTKKTSDTRDENEPEPVQKELIGAPQESHHEERVSATGESGATTTAPTLPEDERIPLDEIKEDLVIEEKHVKEETKEVEVAPPLPTVYEPLERPTPAKMHFSAQQAHMRDVVKTPDEVADLPVHEEADFEEYSEDKDKEAEKERDVKDKTAPEVAQKKQTEVKQPEKTDKIVADKSAESDKQCDTVKDVQEEVQEVIEKMEIDTKLDRPPKPDGQSSPVKEKLDEAAALKDLESQIIPKESEVKEKIEPPAVAKIVETVSEPEAPVDDEEDKKSVHEEVIVPTKVEPKVPVPAETSVLDEIWQSPAKAEEKLDELKNIIDDKAKETTSDLIAMKDEMVKELVDRKEEIVETVKAEIAEADSKIKDTVVELGKETEQAAITAADEVVKDVTSKIEQIGEDLQSKAEKADEKLAAGVESIKADVEQTAAKATEVLEAIATEKKELEELAKELKEDVAAKLDETKKQVEIELNKTVEQVQEKAKTGMSSFFGEITNGIKTGIEKIADTMETKIKDKTEQVEGKLQQVSDKLDELKGKEVTEEPCQKKEEPKVPETSVGFDASFGRSFTQELRETHITTLDSPIGDTDKVVELKPTIKIPQNIDEDKELEEIEDAKQAAGSFVIEEVKYSNFEDANLRDIKEEEEEDRVSPPQKEDKKLISPKLEPLMQPPRSRTPEDVAKIVANVAEVLKSDKDLEEIIPGFDPQELERKLSQGAARDEDVSTVQRMLVTTSSEDGGEEIDICPAGTITFSKSATPEATISGKTTPEIRVDEEVCEQKKEAEEKVEKPKLPEVKPAEKTSPTSSGKSSPDLKTSPTSIEEKEKHELPEKVVTDVKKTPEKVPEERKESLSDQFDRIDDSRRESAISTFSERDYTKDESSFVDERDSSRAHSISSHISELNEDDAEPKVSDEKVAAEKATKPDTKKADDLSSPESITSQKTVSEKSVADKEPVADKSEPPAKDAKSDSVLDHVSEKTESKEPSRPESATSEQPTSDKQTEASRPESAASHISEKASSEKQAAAEPSRPESAASHVSEKTPSEGKQDAKEVPPPESSTVEKPEEKSKSPMEDAKDASRPESVTSQLSEKAPSEKPEAKEPSRPESAASHVSEKAASEKPEASRPESVASHVSEKASPEKVEAKEASRPESVASHVSDKAPSEKPEAKEASRPESAASHVSEKASPEKPDTKETSRPESVASHVSEKVTTEKPEPKEPSRPESVTSHVSEKAASEKPEADGASRPESAASQVSEKASPEKPETKEASRPESASSLVSEKVLPEKPEIKEASRPESAASHVSEKASPEKPATTEASRPESAASHASEKASPEKPPTTEASRPESAASHVSEKASPEKPVTTETSRPESAASHESEKAPVEKPEAKEASRPESAASHVSEKALSEKQETTVASRPESVASAISEKASPEKPEAKEATRPESAASQISEKVPSEKPETKEASRPESVASHISEKASSEKAEDKGTSRPESAASHVSEKSPSEQRDVKPDVKEVSRPTSVASQVSEKAASQKSDEKLAVDQDQLSRPESAASHVSELASHEDKAISRPDSAASHVSDKPEQKSDNKEKASVDVVPEETSADKSASKEASRPESVASHVSEKIEDGKSTDKTSDGAASRPESVASHVSEKATAEKSDAKQDQTSRPESVTSQVSEAMLGEKRESLASQSSEKTTSKDETKPEEKPTTTIDGKLSEPTTDASRPTSAASGKSVDQKDEKQASETKSPVQVESSDKPEPLSMSSHESAQEEKKETHGPESATGQADKTQSSRPDSVASHISEQKSTSRPESAASHVSELGSGDKSPVVQKSEEKETAKVSHGDEIPVGKAESRPESVASHFSEDKEPSRPTSRASEKVDTSKPEQKQDDKVQASIGTDTKSEVSADKVEESKSPRPESAASVVSDSGKKEDKAPSRPESAASHASAAHEKEESRPTSVASHASEKVEAQKEVSRPLSAASQVSEKSPSVVESDKAASRPESATSHISTKTKESTLDDKESSRPVSVASHSSEKIQTAEAGATQPIINGDYSRPESPASCSSDKVVPAKESESKFAEKDLARQDSTASYHGEPIPDEKSFSRPDSPASFGEDHEKVTEQVKPASEKKETSQTDEKDASPASDAKSKQEDGEEFSRPDSPASCGDASELPASKASESTVPEKDLARKDSNASYHGEEIPGEKAFSRPESPESGAEDQVKPASRPESVLSEKAASDRSAPKEASRPESVASHMSEKDKSPITTETDASKSPPADERPKHDTSRPESAASHVSERSTTADGKDSQSRRESASKDDRPSSALSDHADEAEDKIVLKESRSKSLSAVMSSTTQRSGFDGGALGVLEEMATSRDDLHVLKTPRDSITKIEELKQPIGGESKLDKPLFGVEQFPAGEKAEVKGFPATAMEKESPDHSAKITPGLDQLLKETCSSMKEIEKMSTSVITMIKSSEKKDETTKVDEKGLAISFPLLDSGKSTPGSVDKDKSQTSSIKSASPHEKDSLEESSASLNTFIEKDSLSESTTKQVTIKMSAIEESQLKAASSSMKMDSSELLGGSKTPPTAPISPNVVKEDFGLGQHVESTLASSTTMTTTSTSSQVVKSQKEDASGISTPKESVPSGKSSPGLMSVHTGSTDSASKSINLGHSSGIETSDSSPKPTSPFPKVLDSLKTDDIKTSSGMSTPDMTRTSTPDMVDSQIERVPEDKSTTITTTTTTKTTSYIIKDGEKIEVGTAVKTETSSDDRKKDDISSAGESLSTSSVTTTTTTKIVKEPVKTPATLTLASTEDRSLTEEFDDKDALSPRSDISSGQASRIVAGWHDEDVPGSPMSVTSQAPLSPSTKYTYDYDFQHSSSGVSKKSDIEIDDSQDEIPPQYDSEEVKSAITIASAYKPDPMSTSFYGQLPDVSDTTVTTASATTKSVPIPITAGKAGTKTYMEYASSGDSSSVDSSLHKPSRDSKYLDDADLDFEKTFTKSDRMDLMTTSMHFSSEKEFMAATTIAPSAPTTIADSSKKELDFTASGLPSTVTTQQAQTSVTTTAQSSTSTTSASSSTTDQSQSNKNKEDILASWGKPLGLPSPAPLNETTPKKERRMIISKTRLNNEKNLRKRSESPNKPSKKPAPVYVDLSYVPHHGNSYYANVEFFKRVRARYYVFSGTEPSREVYNALLEAKQTWEDKELEVTIIPTYDTDVLGYWVSENEDLLAKYHIDLSPSAARCTINLQDHETSCSAYRLEF